MKKTRHASLTALCALTAALITAAARGGWVYDGEITIPAGATNASATAVIRGGDSATNHVSAIDRVAAVNAAGTATGAVTFAAIDLTGTNVLSASANLAPGAVHNAYSVTNAAGQPRQARYITVSVAQTATNAAPAVYRWLIGTR